MMSRQPLFSVSLFPSAFYYILHSISIHTASSFIDDYLASKGGMVEIDNVVDAGYPSVHTLSSKSITIFVDNVNSKINLVLCYNLQ
jgi:hypothetical protein